MSETPCASTGHDTVELSTLERAAAAVQDLADRTIRAGSVSALTAARTRTFDRRVHLVVAGQFKRGKSTLVNALLGRAVLPTGVTPLTAIPTLVEFGSHDDAIVTFHGGASRPINLAELPAFVTERDNPNNSRAVVEVRVRIPSPVLLGGLVLVDLPGTGSLHDQNTEQAHRFLDQADAALFVVSADPPISADELVELDLLRSHVEDVVCVVNKLDQITPPDRALALGYTRRELDAHGQADVPVVGASAQCALHPEASANEGDHIGIGTLTAILDSRIQTRLSAIINTQLHRTTIAALDSICSALDLERASSKMAADDRHQRMREFSILAEEIRDELRDGAIIARARTQRVMADEIEPALRSLGNSAAATITDRLGAEWQREAPTGDDPMIEVKAWIADAVLGWADQTTALMRAGIDPILRDQAEQANRLRALAMRSAASLFQLSVPPGSVAAPAPKVVTEDLLLLDDDATGGLELLVAATRGRLPGALGKWSSRRAARSRALGLLDRHVGRLRSACAQAIDRALASVARSEVAALDQSLRLIETAIGEGERAASRTESERGQRLAQIDDDLREAGLLRRVLEDVALGSTPAENDQALQRSATSQPKH